MKALYEGSMKAVWKFFEGSCEAIDDGANQEALVEP